MENGEEAGAIFSHSGFRLQTSALLRLRLEQLDRVA